MATSSASLDRSPRKNWVELAGGLHPYHRKIARAIAEKRGVPLDRAIPMALGRLKRWATGGDGVTAQTKALAAAAVAHWEKIRAKSRLKEAADYVARDDAGLPDALLLRLVDEMDDVEPSDRLVEATSARSKGRGATAHGRQRERAAHGRGNAEDDAAHPRARAGSRTGGEFIKSGHAGDDVKAVQARVGGKVDGQFGKDTAARVKALEVEATSLRQRGTTATEDTPSGKRLKAIESELKRLRSRGKSKSRGRLVEAVAVQNFADRVKALEPGEMARMPCGVAVRRTATEDARDVYSAGEPSRYSEAGVSWREQRRDPDEAIADAMTMSAGSTDPLSVGGPTRFSRYTGVLVDGRRAEFVGVDASGLPLVRWVTSSDDLGYAQASVTVGWPRMVRAS